MSAEELRLEELMLRDPSLQAQKIQALKRQLRELRSVLHKSGVAVTDSSAQLPTIYVITPTYARPGQLAELNRVRAVLLHVSRLWWVVVEDREGRSDPVTKFLSSAGVPYTHLSQATPQDWKNTEDAPRWHRPRGVLQRNAGISWLRRNCSPDAPAVVYFADDDNSYSIELFKEMRWTQRVSVWPVGLVGGVMVERPVCLCRQGDPQEAPRVTDWMVGWMPQRNFPIDMAGFAVNIQLLLSKPEASFSLYSKRGYLESDFLSMIVRREELEPRADCCTKVLVWHMNAQKPSLKEEFRLRELGRRTDSGIVV